MVVVVVAGVSSRSRAARAEDAVKKAVGGRLRVKKWLLCWRARHCARVVDCRNGARENDEQRVNRRVVLLSIECMCQDRRYLERSMDLSDPPQAANKAVA